MPEQPYQSILFDLIIGECNIINPSIRHTIFEDGHTLVIYNIKEEDMDKLNFTTNKDSNNNKLSLVGVSVSLEINPTIPVVIPGFEEQLIIAFNNSNARSFRDRSHLHRPFNKIPAGHFSSFKPTFTIGQLTDTLAGITSNTQPTLGKKKLYQLTFTNENLPSKCKNDNGCPSGYKCKDMQCVSKS